MNVLRAVFDYLYEFLLGCRHPRLTRLFTIEQETYRVCLECGKHVYYSAETMLPLSGRELRRLRAAQAGGLKVLAPIGGGVNALNDGKGSKAIA
jgi:hypothetical protein